MGTGHNARTVGTGQLETAPGRGPAVRKLLARPRRYAFGCAAARIVAAAAGPRRDPDGHATALVVAAAAGRSVGGRAPRADALTRIARGGGRGSAALKPGNGLREPGHRPGTLERSRLALDLLRVGRVRGGVIGEAETGHTLHGRTVHGQVRHVEMTAVERGRAVRLVRPQALQRLAVGLADGQRGRTLDADDRLENLNGAARSGEVPVQVGMRERTHHRRGTSLRVRERVRSRNGDERSTLIQGEARLVDPGLIELDAEGNARMARFGLGRLDDALELNVGIEPALSGPGGWPRPAAGSQARARR